METTDIQPTIKTVDFINDTVEEEEGESHTKIHEVLPVDHPESDSEEAIEAFVDAVKERARKSSNTKEKRIESTETGWEEDFPLWDDRKMWIISVKVWRFENVIQRSILILKYRSGAKRKLLINLATRLVSQMIKTFFGLWVIGDYLEEYTSRHHRQKILGQHVVT
jgi:hypothetical protein